MTDNFCKPEENSYNFEEHWNNAYLKTPTKSLGWYEENPEQSISLINECNLLENALIFNAGAGSTTLINKLLEIWMKDSRMHSILSPFNLGV